MASTKEISIKIIRELHRRPDKKSCPSCNGTGWIEVDTHRNSQCGYCASPSSSDIEIVEPIISKLIDNTLTKKTN